MRRAIAAIAVVLLAPATASAETASVAIPGKSFSPSRVTVVAGDSVLWRNGDLVAHDVKAPDFTSGAIGRFGVYTQRFDAVGAHPFVCSIHPFMTGEIDVVGATLSGPSSVFAGEPAELTGRAPAGTASVALERQVMNGWQPMGSATARADGTFTATVRPDSATAYRARTPAGESPPVTVTITEKVTAKLALTAGGVRVTTTPARPGLVATVQVYSRERFAWRWVASAKLDARGRATLKVRRRTGRARVVLSREPRGAALAISAPIRLRDGRAAAGMPQGHAHHHDMN